MAEEGMIVARPRELKNLYVIRKVLDKEITQLEASEILSLSSRQIRRILKRVRVEGDQGVIHKSRGRASNRRTPDGIRDKMMQLYRSQSWDFGPTLAAEKLEERHQVKVNDGTLRRWLIESGDWKKKRRGRGHRRWRERNHHFEEMEHLQWLLQAIKEPQAVSWTQEMKLRSRDRAELLRNVAIGSQKTWKKALWLLGRMHGVRVSTLCLCFGVSRATVCRDWKKFKVSGIEGVFQKRLRCASKENDEEIKAAIFSMIHSPPSEHNINRTSWRLEDICRCLFQQGIHVSKNLVSNIIRGAGYTWRKAKMVLTSNDPNTGKNRIASNQSYLRLGKTTASVLLTSSAPLRSR